LGVANYILGMFIREVKNRSGSISIQIISKHKGKYKVIKTIGSSKDPEEVILLKHKAQHEKERLENQPTLFVSEKDKIIESYLLTLSNSQIRVIGPELIFGKIYDDIGFSEISEEMFRHLVISRLAYPGSKLKMIDYLKRYQGISTSVDTVYRFLDKLHSRLKAKVEEISFRNTLKRIKGKPTIVFYDMTTLHFESSDEDDIRKTGFSKVGKHKNPQIYLGLLVAIKGYPIGYDLYEGNIYEGHTLIPVLKKFERRFNLRKPIVVADAGILSNENIKYLEADGYNYILGARIKNESNKVKEKILESNLSNNKNNTIVIALEKEKRLIVNYSDKRAKKDYANRVRGLKRLEKSLITGKLTKSNINNRGYNKYLKLIGEVNIKIDYDKFDDDKKWDGLKGYITNSDLSSKDVIENYRELWQIEKAFRISKTDLKIRPIYHRLKHRIQAHISIAFTAYAIYKELEAILYEADAPFSVRRAAELTHNIYEIEIILPDSKIERKIFLNMDEEQKILYNILYN
jgi:transposase